MVTVTVILGKKILESNKTAGNNFDSNGSLALSRNTGPLSGSATRESANRALEIVL